MKAKRIIISDTHRVFKSASECDRFIGGTDGTISRKIISHETNYKKLSVPLEYCSEETYLKYKDKILDDKYKNIYQTYQVPCEWCGKLFHPSTPKQKYCDRKHFKTCIICRKDFDITELLKKNKDIPETCSNECASKLKSQRRKELESTPEYHQNVLNKRKQTSRSRYGVDNVSQAPEIKQVLSTKLKEDYQSGKRDFQRTQVQKFWKDQHNIEQANFKKQETNIKRFGTAWFTQTPESRVKYGLTLEQGKLCSEYYRDPESFVQKYFDHTPTTKELSDLLGTSEPIHLLKGSSSIRWNVSTIEQEVTEYLLSIKPDLEIYHNDRTQIRPFELDLWIPEFKLGIECNPTVTHNSSVGFLGSDPLSYNYHENKTNLAEKQEIFLFHIFGYDWSYRKTQVKHMLRNLIKCNERTVFARKCKIEAVDQKTSRQFLNDNHLQGYVSAQVNLGLFSGDRLVSLMTFSHSRYTIGKIEHKESSWELVRFCSLYNTNVIGGASKLFKYFVKYYSPEDIVSFSDRSHTRGNLYQILGFEKINQSGPNYVWVNSEDKAFHRINAQKHNLKRFLKDDNIDLTKTEKQIMEDHGFVQVFDSGTITWKWTE